MTEHLPECLVPDFDKGLWICICNQLRACEQRVGEEQCSTCCTRAEQQYVVEFNSGRRVGYEAALDAAREAMLGAGSIDVASGRALDGHARFVWMGHALSAIDALKKERDD